MEFSREVIEYIRKIYSDNGIYILHPYVTKNIDTPSIALYQQLYIAAEYKAKNGPFPIDSNSFINRQALELMKMVLYTKTKENK